MKRLAILSCLLFVFFGPAPAHAKWSAPARLPGIYGSAHVTALKAPSKDHPQGTLAIFQRRAEAIRNDNEATFGDILAWEWDVETEKVVTSEKLIWGAGNPTEPHIDVASQSGRVYLLASNASSLEDEAVVLMTLDGKLGLIESETIGHGLSAGFAVSEKWIVVGYYERREPIAPPRGVRVPVQLHHAYHVVVMNRATGIIAGAHVFLGTELYSPPNVYGYPQGIAIEETDDGAYIAIGGLALVDIVHVTLPTLAPKERKIIDGLGVISGAGWTQLVDGQVVVGTGGGTRLLSPALVPVQEISMSKPSWNRKTGKVLLNTKSYTNPVPKTWSTIEVHGCDDYVWAWDRAFCLTLSEKADDHHAATVGSIKIWKD